MKKVFVLCIILAALFSVANVQAENITTIYIRNLSTSISPQEIKDDLPAFQFAVDQLGHYWHLKVRLTTEPEVGDWTISILDKDGPCAFDGCVLGYHNATRSGYPYAVIYLRTIRMFQQRWEETLTHELFEMIVDPEITRTIFDGRLKWLVEVADPVVELHYSLPNANQEWIPIADFVTPAWYKKGSKWPYDLMGRLKRPRILVGRGYAAYWGVFLGQSVWVPVSGPGSLDVLVP